MFRNRTARLGFRPENGLQVLAQGQVSLYAARGDYQLIIQTLEAAGDGLLRMRFEALKRQLFEEGLFDAAHKQPLPEWPRQIGVVTSPSGAAVRDIVTVLARRCPLIPVLIYPTAVQGTAAAAEIVRAIETANRRAECDVLIVGRGGGSLEDLWSFNEEAVARAIFASDIPVVSAVGHEIDFTIADLVADMRAATPSAAAELLSPDVAATTRRLSALEQRLTTLIRHQISDRGHRVRQLRSRLVSPQRRLETNYQRVDELSQRLSQAIRTRLALTASSLNSLSVRVAARSPASILPVLNRDLERLSTRLHKAMRSQLDIRTQALARLGDVLRAVGPSATLERGYAIVTRGDGAIVRDAIQLTPGERLDTRLARGRFTSDVAAVTAADDVPAKP